MADDSAASWSTWSSLSVIETTMSVTALLRGQRHENGAQIGKVSF